MQKLYVNSDEIQIILNNQEVINVHTSVINKLYFDVISISHDWCKDTKEFRIISNIQNLQIEFYTNDEMKIVGHITVIEFHEGG